MSVAHPEHPIRVLIVGSVAIVVVSLLVLFGRSTQSGPAAVQRPVAIVDISPAEGQLLIPQGTIAATVRATLTAQLTFDHTVIPQDQLDVDPSIGTYSFTPGAGKEFREFPKGKHSITLEYWPRGISTAETAKAQKKLAAYTWAVDVG